MTNDANNVGREWIRERVREQLRKQMDKRAREHIPADIQEAIRQQKPGAGGWVREAFADVGFLIIFFVFVLIGSMYLGQRTMFYTLSLILLSIIIVNADKLKRLLELLRVI